MLHLDKVTNKKLMIYDDEQGISESSLFKALIEHLKANKGGITSERSW